MMSGVLKFSSRQCKEVLKFSSAQVRHQQTQNKPKPQSVSRSTDVIPVFRKAATYNDRTAIRDTLGSYTYTNLFLAAKELSIDISKRTKGKTNDQVLFLCPNDANYIITQWAVWMSGQTAVPMNTVHPENMLEYYVRDSNSKLVITTPEYSEMMHKVAKTTNSELYVIDENLRQDSLTKNEAKPSDLDVGQPPEFYNKKNAMILYTSGTTGNPKGVLLTHKNVIAQVTTLLDAWKWTQNDVILHALPLHHVHGIVNALLCPLYIGAKCIMLPKYDTTTVWSYLLGVNMSPDDRKITVFMGVPTIYAKLIGEHERVFSKDPKMTEYIKTSLKSKVRLMVSGSAPLPVPLHEKWFEISGHKLLERYGMTEIGMCLSQQYESKREAGYVGAPLPGVTIRLGQQPDEDDGESDYTTILECSNENGEVKLKINDGFTGKDELVGELLVKGDSVFKEYFNRAETTQKEFTVGKWFKTGDICQYSLDKKLFKMLGRTSVDIIKTGGYKVSALEVETHLLGHSDIDECAVVGRRDQTWGEVVAAVVVVKPGSQVSLESLKEWAKGRMSDYTVPRELKVVDAIPRNAMGKINKRELVAKVFA